MFLADAVAGYVESLSERELDAPLIALLYSLGYHHVHLVHGQYEFGKDLIAQKSEVTGTVQYCIQSKSGDLNAHAWRQLRLQVDAMRSGTVVHPDFDPNLPRKLVVATNGRLTGGAGVEFQDYNTYHLGRAEEPAILWDRDYLVPKFMTVLIDGVPARTRSRTLEMLGRLGQGSGTRTEANEYSRQWFEEALPALDKWEQVLTASMLAAEAAGQGREDLAIQLALMLARGLEGLESNSELSEQGEIALKIFQAYAERFWEQVKDQDLVEISLETRTPMGAFVIHPIRVARISECLSLLGILWTLEADPRAHEIAEAVDTLNGRTPALSHLVSDEWAFSLLCTTTFLAMHSRIASVERILRAAAVWLLDRIEFASGIAPVGTPLPEAITRLLGPAYPSYALTRESSSYAFAVVLDVAYISGLTTLYSDLVHDLTALRAAATIVVKQAGEDHARLIARIDYRIGDPPAFHHTVVQAPAGSARRRFLNFASWATLRDRHVPNVLRSLIYPD